MPSIYNNFAASTLLPRAVAWVNAKRSPADSWQYVPYLYPLQCVDAAAPDIGHADLAYEFGTIKREDSTQKFPFAPYNLGDYWIQIVMQRAGEGPQVAWTGIVTDDEPTFDRPDVSAGSQRIRAYQASHLLDRSVMSSARVQSGTAYQTIQWIPAFNARSRIGFSLDGNRSEQLGPDGVYVFSKDGEVWTCLDVVRYLCQYHAPAGLQIQLVGQADLLSSIKEVWQFEGVTLWQALNQLIDRRRGVGFYPIAGDGNLFLWVFSLTERDIQIGSHVLPANPMQTFFRLPDSRPYTHFVEDLALRRTTSNYYDRIIVRGARARVTGTFSFEDGNLVKGWSGDLEDEYVTAKGSDGEENDRFRQSDRFRSVFTTFIVPPNWDGKVGDGEGGSKQTLRIQPTNDGFMETQKGEGAFYYPDKTFLRELPLLVGWDYSEEPPADLTETGVEPAFAQPLVLVRYTFTEDPTYHRIETLSDSLRDAVSASCYMLDKQLGVRVMASPQHAFAHSKMDSLANPEAGPSDQDVQLLNYDTLILTATFESDERPHVVLENFGPSGMGRTLTVDVPDAEFWYVAPGTVLDVDRDDPARLKKIADTNIFVRNDKEKLDAIAAFLAGWYGVRRQAVEIPIQSIGMFVQVGALLTEIQSANLVEPIRTVVTSRLIDFAAGKTTLKTGYGNLDFAGVTQFASDRSRRRKVFP